MTTTEADKAVSHGATPWAIENLPPFPALATRLLQLLSQEDVNVNEVARTVSAEPVFAARVLQLANSPLFAVRAEVKSIPQAIIMLGLARVRAITVTRALGDFIAPAINFRTLRMCWRNTLAGAIVAEELAKASGIDADLAYLAGLLRDIGRLALLIKYPREYDTLLAVTAEEHFDLLATERELFDVDHCEAGASVVERFALPPEFADVIARHHEPLKEGRLCLAALVGCADRLADAIGFALITDIARPSFADLSSEFNAISGRRFENDPEVLRTAIEEKIAAWA